MIARPSWPEIVQVFQARRTSGQKKGQQSRQQTTKLREYELLRLLNFNEVTCIGLPRDYISQRRFQPNHSARSLGTARYGNQEKENHNPISISIVYSSLSQYIHIRSRSGLPFKDSRNKRIRCTYSMSPYTVHDLTRPKQDQTLHETSPPYIGIPRYPSVSKQKKISSSDQMTF